MEDRLKSIEDKVTKVEQEIDKVGDALVILARLEERIISLFKNLEGHTEAMKGIEKRVQALEAAMQRLSVWGNIGDKTLWIIIGGFATAAIGIGSKVWLGN